MPEKSQRRAIPRSPRAGRRDRQRQGDGERSGPDGADRPDEDRIVDPPTHASSADTVETRDPAGGRPSISGSTGVPAWDDGLLQAEQVDVSDAPAVIERTRRASGDRDRDES
ncbi:MAG TPA: hypothetical protein VFC53_05380 [Dehalococcoidia bacterium]|nr:hypothetical protein [Dehalococcoidia bacterium]